MQYINYISKQALQLVCTISSIVTDPIIIIIQQLTSFIQVWVIRISFTFAVIVGALISNQFITLGSSPETILYNNNNIILKITHLILYT